MTIAPRRRRGPHRQRFELLDLILSTALMLHALIVFIPFLSVVAGSFATHKEFLESRLLLLPLRPTLDNYAELFRDGRIWIGYRTTLLLLCFGAPLNLFLTTSMAYGLSRRSFPGKRVIVYLVVFTMLFNGGIIPMYLLMLQLHLTNTLWSVILATGMNTFYMIIMLNYFNTLPDALIESAKLDGAGEWRILFQIILPISAPILATVALFYAVDRWNEWWYAMIFIRKNDLITLQLLLRNIIVDSRMSDTGVAAGELEVKFTDGVKMCAVIVTMLPVMCVFPLLQRYFVKGILVGAIKA